MSKTTQVHSLNFAAACAYLEVSPEDLRALSQRGLVTFINESGKQLYRPEVLEITRRLLQVQRAREWSDTTLAWYADLSFARAIGSALLLPMNRNEQDKKYLAATWLATPNITHILGAFEEALNGDDAAFNNTLRSIALIAVGEGQFWENQAALEQSALYPIIALLESKGVLILNQADVIARDYTATLIALIYVFTNTAPPLSAELAKLIEFVQPRLQSNLALTNNTYSEDQSLIKQESGVAVDHLYATRAPEIYLGAREEDWEKIDGVISVKRRTIQLEMDLSNEELSPTFDNILDIIKPYLGEFGRRVVLLLYTVANDDPYWRKPQIQVDTNELLDRLGLKRDKRGIHRSKNRERLRDVLNAAHYLEIVGEYPGFVNGKPMRLAFRRTVLSLIGAAYDPTESEGMSTSSLFRRGLAKFITLRLNFYDGIRRQDGQLGDSYVLLPRLEAPENLDSANHMGTYEALHSYFLLRYRQTRNRTLVITRQTALERANIRNKSGNRATSTLRKAIDRLVEAGVIENCSPVPPSNPNESFEVLLSESAIANQ
jgi:hypothetical protein